MRKTYEILPQVARSSHFILKMRYFLGKIEDGHNFLKMHKVATMEIVEKDNIIIFKTLCGLEVAT